MSRSEVPIPVYGARPSEVVVNPWTQMFHKAMDAVLEEAQERAQVDSLPVPQKREDLFQVGTLLTSPEELTDAGSIWYYQNLGKEVGRNIQSHPQRDDMTREAARYAASLAKELIKTHTPKGTSQAESDAIKNVIASHMASFAVGIVINTESETALGGFDVTERHTDGSETVVFHQPDTPVKWKGRTTRDRVIKEFHVSMQA